MSSLNARPAPQHPGKTAWKRALSAAGSAGAGALAVVLALAFLPGATELTAMLAPAISSANASNSSTGANATTPRESRKHRLADAHVVQHGSYVSDPYGCLYMIQYRDANLSLTPILDEQRQRLCPLQGP